MLARITAPHFCAGLVFDGNMRVIEAAPILRYMIGWSAGRVIDYCSRKHWQNESVGE